MNPFALTLEVLLEVASRTPFPLVCVSRGGDGVSSGTGCFSAMGSLLRVRPRLLKKIPRNYYAQSKALLPAWPFRIGWLALFALCL